MQSYKPAPPASLELAYNSDIKIREVAKRTPKLIIEMINYLYVLLNVKSGNRLTKLEESVLNGVILTSFSGYSINEIKHAFRLALAGTIQVKLYNKLDSIALSAVMKAYKDYKNNKLKQELNGSWETKKPTNTEREAIEKEFIESVVVPLWENYDMSKEWKVSQSHWLIYDLFNKKGLVDLSDETKSGCMNLASRYHKIDQQQRQLTNFAKIREAPPNSEAIKNIAKSFALKQLLFEMKLAETNLIDQLK